MNFVGHHIERCGLVCVHACEMLGRIKFVIEIGPTRCGYCSILEMDQLQGTYPCQFDNALWELDRKKNHALSRHKKITVGTLRNLCDNIYQIEDA